MSLNVLILSESLFCLFFLLLYLDIIVNKGNVNDFQDLNKGFEIEYCVVSTDKTQDQLRCDIKFLFWVS